MSHEAMIWLGFFFGVLAQPFVGQGDYPINRRSGKEEDK
jgi:hypothetical protein